MKITSMIIAALVLTIAPIGTLMVFNVSETGEQDPGIEDTTPPTSTIDSPTFYLIPPLYDSIGSMGFKVIWEGSDNEGGVGIDHFDVQYRTVPSNCYGSYGEGTYVTPLFPYWHDLVMNTTETSTFVNVYHDMFYEFRVRAVDLNGNEESWSDFGETRTLVISIPYPIYQAIMFGRMVKEEALESVRERIPGETPPVSRVLPLPPIALPEPIVTATGDPPEILMYPDIDCSDPDFSPADDLFGYWDYGSIKVKWEGRDLKGSEGLRFDVQYRCAYLESDLVYIPEAPIKPPVVPQVTNWTDWVTNTTVTEEYFKINGPGLYEFRCRATDVFGNVEEYPLTADACTFVLPMV